MLALDLPEQHLRLALHLLHKARLARLLLVLLVAAPRAAGLMRRPAILGGTVRVCLGRAEALLALARMLCGIRRTRRRRGRVELRGVVVRVVSRTLGAPRSVKLFSAEGARSSMERKEDR